jgi:periplasmic mercuric ion binding protein
MKNLFILIVLACGIMSFKQDKVQSATIQTSAECGSCKERLEEKLNYTKGVVFSNLDVPTKVLTVKFKTEKITLEEIKKIVSELGYDADDVKANPEKQKKLPKCCQPGGMKSH